MTYMTYMSHMPHPSHITYNPKKRRKPKMKKIIVTVLTVFCLFLALTARVEILKSPIGAISQVIEYQTPGQLNYAEINMINLDGTLNEAKWENWCKKAKEEGATGIREIPYWPEYAGDNFVPWQKKGSSFDLSRHNHMYFYNLKKFVQIANNYGLKVYFSLFDNCGLKFANNPWNSNINGIKTFYDISEESEKQRKYWIDLVTNQLRHMDIGYELCNEPADERWAKVGVEVYIYLNKEKGIKSSDIIMGVQWGTSLYRKFRTELIKRIGENKWTRLKHLMPSTIHRASLNMEIDGLTLSQHIKNQLMPGGKPHKRRFKFSTDGLKPKPIYNEVYHFSKLIFDHALAAAEKNRYIIEIVEKHRQHPHGTIRAVAKAYNEARGLEIIQYPEIDREIAGIESALAEIQKRLENLRKNLKKE